MQGKLPVCELLQIAKDRRWCQPSHAGSRFGLGLRWPLVGEAPGLRLSFQRPRTLGCLVQQFPIGSLRSLLALGIRPKAMNPLHPAIVALSFVARTPFPLIEREGDSLLRLLPGPAVNAHQKGKSLFFMTIDHRLAPVANMMAIRA